MEKHITVCFIVIVLSILAIAEADIGEQKPQPEIDALMKCTNKCSAESGIFFNFTVEEENKKGLQAAGDKFFDSACMQENCAKEVTEVRAVAAKSVFAKKDTEDRETAPEVSAMLDCADRKCPAELKTYAKNGKTKEAFHVAEETFLNSACMQKSCVKEVIQLRALEFKSDQN